MRSSPSAAAASLMLSGLSAAMAMSFVGVGVVKVANAFQPMLTVARTSISRAGVAAAFATRLQQRRSSPFSLDEFEHLFQETPSLADMPSSLTNRRIELPQSSSGGGESDAVFMVSSFSGSARANLVARGRWGGGGGETTTTLDESAASSATTVEGDGEMDGMSMFESDPYADLEEEPAYQTQQIVPPGAGRQAQDRGGLEAKLKNMDIQDIITTLIVPGILAYVGLRWTFNKVNARVTDRRSGVLDSFAREMIYHDGDAREMKLCCQSYKKRPALLALGPMQTRTMLKRYLTLYTKKRTVSPQAISSLSIAFSIFNLNELQVADLLVSLSQDLGTDNISSVGKLLFFGNRILKDDVARARLTPIKELIQSTYRDIRSAESIVDTSQAAMAEAAYRTAVQSAGKSQTSLTPGWEVLGLDKETATRIFEDEAQEGFLTDRESMYGGQTRKYDKRGRIIDDSGNLVNEDDIAAAKAAGESTNVKEGDAGDDDGDGGGGGGGGNNSMPTSNVYECGQCGYTLFIAKGRESKFFGENFRCPDCGAAKDKFEPKNMNDDE